MNSNILSHAKYIGHPLNTLCLYLSVPCCGVDHLTINSVHDAAMAKDILQHLGLDELELVLFEYVEKGMYKKAITNVTRKRGH